MTGQLANGNESNYDRANNEREFCPVISIDQTIDSILMLRVQRRLKAVDGAFGVE